ncbi:MAG TPA: imidazolonepropionase [Actinomycetota bacterium]|nr:imidazolonepropionase [Actinomycetota bacterium]
MDGARGAIVAAAIATPGSDVPRRGADLAAIERPGAVGVAWRDGVVTFVGPADDLPGDVGEPAGSPDRGTLVPGFVDCHTHLPFVGWRADEFEARLAGRSYADLHGEEGGIFRSARMLAESGDDEVLAFSERLASDMLATGTTTIELKTGYGLSVDGELRQARLARALAGRVRQTCRVTLLACHAVPRGVERSAWVTAVCDDLIPAAAGEDLVDQVDVYVERIAFDLDDLTRVAGAAAAAGLPLRVHADQLTDVGATSTAVRLGARSVDHLNHCNVEGVAALANAGSTAAVLLPASTFFLRGAAPPVAALRDAEVPIAIATDLNPGTSPVASMPEAIAIACAAYGLTPLDALTAATRNAAWVLGVDRGTLAVGSPADLLLLDVPSFAHVPYRPGRNPVAATIVGGELTVGDPSAVVG